MSFTTQAKSVSGSTKEQLAERKKEEPEVSPDGRGGYNEREYQEEIREKLPKEIQEFATIFSTKK